MLPQATGVTPHYLILWNDVKNATVPRPLIAIYYVILADHLHVLSLIQLLTFILTRDHVPIPRTHREVSIRIDISYLQVLHNCIVKFGTNASYNLTHPTDAQSPAPFSALS